MIRRQFVTAAATCLALAIGVGSSVAQQGRMPPGMGMGMLEVYEMRGDAGSGLLGGSCGVFGQRWAEPFTEGRIAFLRAELRPTDAQKAAWENIVTAVRKNIENIQSLRQSNQAAAEGTHAPGEWLDRRISILESRLAMLKEIKAPLQALSTSFTDEQKKKAAELLVDVACMR